MATTPFGQRYEDEASPRVAAVYADIRRRMSFVPALFKALAFDEDALECAWLQARTIVDDAGFATATARIRTAATGRAPTRPSPRLRDALLPFATDLPGMLLIASSLRASLDGDLPRGEPTGTIEPGNVPPESPVPEVRGEHPLYPAIREEYGTAHVPTLYRSLAARGLLEEGWAIAAEVLRDPEGADRVRLVADLGREEALAFGTVGCFDAESSRHIVEQLVVALPRNLVVALTLAADA
jgi:hypothetical protein